jgi:cell division protein ZapA
MGSPNDQTVYEVALAGLSLKLKSSHDEKTVRKLVEIVNQELDEAMPRTKSGSLQTAALLACLNIAEQLITLKSRAHYELDRLDKRASITLERLESSRKPGLDLDC